MCQDRRELSVIRMSLTRQRNPVGRRRECVRGQSELCRVVNGTVHGEGGGGGKLAMVRKQCNRGNLHGLFWWLGSRAPNPSI